MEGRGRGSRSEPPPRQDRRIQRLCASHGKSFENIALQRAFYAIVPEPTVKEMGFFKDKVLAFPEAYSLGGEVLSEDDGEVIYMVFVDVGAVRDVVAASKLEGKTPRVGVLTRK